MNTVFMNSENNRTSEYHLLVLKLRSKKRSINVALSNVSICYK